MSDAIMGTFVTLKTMADGTPRLTLDMQCSLADVAAMGLVPGVPFGVVRLTKEASVAPAVEPAPQPKQKVGELCLMACTFCADPLFREWLSETSDGGEFTELAAKETILAICSITSRKELDTNHAAAKIFHHQIREPFLEWKRRAA